MEKKTIGSFISALRRAAGMTQRELAEKLFVSDKTVSRWERDECAPELSLLPVIADLFGVTVDELLRGERNGSSGASSGDTASSEPTPHQRAKSERSFRVLLERRRVRFRNCSMISVGIALLGLIVAAIINLGFIRASIAFWTATALLSAAVICQICFTTSARMRADEEEDRGDTETRTRSVDVFNGRCLLTAKNVITVIACLFAFCLPLVTVDDAYCGLTFGAWLRRGGVCAAVAFIAAYSLWELIVRRLLIRRGALVQSEAEANGYTAERRLLGRSLGIFAAVGVLVMVVSIVLQSINVAYFSVGQTFHTQEEFITFAEDPHAKILVYRGWFTEEYEARVEQELQELAPSKTVAEKIGVAEPSDDEPVRTEFYGRDGEVLFTYINRVGIAYIELSDSDDGFPVRVHTSAQIRAGYRFRDNIGAAVIFGYGIFGAVVVVVYVKKLLALRRKYHE